MPIDKDLNVHFEQPAHNLTWVDVRRVRAQVSYEDMNCIICDKKMKMIIPQTINNIEYIDISKCEFCNTQYILSDYPHKIQFLTCIINDFVIQYTALKNSIEIYGGKKDKVIKFKSIQQLKNLISTYRVLA